MTKTAFCFDLDGTVTSEEILPLIAKYLQIYDEIETLTVATMQGLIPFDKSFSLRIRLLRDAPIPIVQEIVRKVRLQQEIIQFIQNNRDICFIVTGNLDVWIKPLVERIGCKFYCAEADNEGPVLKGLKKGLNKGSVVDELKNSFDRIVVVGDGMNDAPMFEKADIKIAYGGVHSPVSTLINLANYVTYHQRGLCNILNTLSYRQQD